MNEEPRFTPYSLLGLLPDESQLVLDREQLILSQLLNCAIVEQQKLTETELQITVTLFSSYPYHTPLEQLLSVYTGRDIEKCRKQIRRAQQEGRIETLMRPVRNRLSFFRPKLHAFGLDVKSIVDTGYMLINDNGKRSGRAS